MNDDYLSNPFVRAVWWIFGTIHGIALVFEGTAIETAAALLPWLTPLAPASIVYGRLIEKFGFASWQSFVTALVLEGLGLASIHTTLLFWNHNRKYTSEKNHVPLWIPVAVFIFYLIALVSISTLSEFPIDRNDPNSIIRIIVIFCISLLSAPGLIIVGVRSLHKDTISEIRDRYGKRSQTNVRQKVDKPKKRQTFDRGFDGFLQYVKEKGELPSDKVLIASEMGRSPRQIDRYLSKYDDMFGDENEDNI